MRPIRSETLSFMTGEHSGLPRPPAISEPGQGGKFMADGSVLSFPGNTFVCHVLPDTPSHRAITELQNALKAAPFARYFSFLPPSSFHMTVFQGVCMPKEAQAPFPEGTAREDGLDDITETMLKRLQPVSFPDPFSIEAVGPFLHSGLGIHVDGKGDAAKSAMWQTRRDLREALKLDFVDFDAYRFHISLAYLLEWLTPDQAFEIRDTLGALVTDLADAVPEIEIGMNEFCTFDTMHHFEPIYPPK